MTQNLNWPKQHRKGLNVTPQMLRFENDKAYS